MNAVESFVVVPGNDVKPGKKPLATAPYEEALKRALGGGELEAYSRDTKRLLAPEARGYAHGFIAAANAAYDGHYPLVISPDMIWLLIAQGFAIHVKENAEALRGKFVAHKGKVELEVEGDGFVRGFAGNDWEGVFGEFSAQIRMHIGKSAHESIAPAFSTTGIVEKAAFEITLLNAMQEYFSYTLLTRCGIPEFQLLGSVNDWKKVYEHAETLCKYDLSWWASGLLPLLEEFVYASQSRSNPSFWSNFYKRINGSGGPFLTGNIVYLFPYLLRTSGKYRRNEMLAQKNIDPLHGIQTGSFPHGFSVAPFLWKYYAREFPMDFVAGFVGASQDAKTLAIRPEIGWAVRERTV